MKRLLFAAIIAAMFTTGTAFAQDTTVKRHPVKKTRTTTKAPITVKRKDTTTSSKRASTAKPTTPATKS